MIVAWDFDGVLNRNVVDGRLIWSDRFDQDIGDLKSFRDHVFHTNFDRIIRGEEDLLDRVAAWVSQTGCDSTAEQILDYWFTKDALPDPALRTVMDDLAARGVHQVIATNNEPRRTEFIETATEFGRRVERVFSSGRMGVAKPDPAFFRQITETLGADPSEMIFIDDHAQNVEAANALGWHTYHFTDDTRAGLSAFLTKNLPRDPADISLATYGTLAPGQVNHHVMDGMTGRWATGHVRGTLIAEGWGADHGCPGIVLDPDGDEVPVHIFVSTDLPWHWDRLDEFEGAEYKREAVDASTPDGPKRVSIYRLAR